MSRSNNANTAQYDLYIDGRGNVYEDDIPTSAIRQRITDSFQDDTHPSTDSDLDAQENYDLGLH